MAEDVARVLAAEPTSHLDLEHRVSRAVALERRQEPVVTVWAVITVDQEMCPRLQARIIVYEALTPGGHGYQARPPPWHEQVAQLSA